MLADLNARYPGLRFRIVDEQERVRPHFKLFVGSDIAESLDQHVAPGDTLMIAAALSGG